MNHLKEMEEALEHDVPALHDEIEKLPAGHNEFAVAEAFAHYTASCLTCGDETNVCNCFDAAEKLLGHTDTTIRTAVENVWLYSVCSSIDRQPQRRRILSLMSPRLRAEANRLVYNSLP